MRTVKEIKEIATAWKELSREMCDFSVESVINECNMLEALGEEWGYEIPCCFRVIKGGHMTMSSTYYKFDDDEYYVHWDSGIGRLQFVTGEYYDDIKEEWQQFLAKLNDYKPLDSDIYNNHIVYDVENGKRLMNDYNDICEQTREVIQKKIKKVRTEKLKKELEELEAENEAD